jgi:hypothetical protein
MRRIDRRARHAWLPPVEPSPSWKTGIAARSSNADGHKYVVLCVVDESPEVLHPSVLRSYGQHDHLKNRSLATSQATP